MVAETETSRQDERVALVAKARTLTARVRTLADRNVELAAKVGLQQAEIKDLRTRLRDFEKVRKEARKRLRHLVSQLPAR